MVSGNQSLVDIPNLQTAGIYLPAVFSYYINNMTTFSRIHYTDAYYVLEDQKDLVTKLPKNEAFGYITKETSNCIVVHFIKKVEDTNPLKITKGLILPIGSISRQTTASIKELDTIKPEQYISITWNDIVFVSNDTKNECSIMYTEGIVFKNNIDHIVIKNPETLRIYPTPIQNHPKVRPLYYIIPKPMITKFEIITKQ